MKRTYKKRLETPIGTFYLLYNDVIPNCYCALLDSNSKWFTNIYHKETIKKLKQIKSVGDLVDLGIAENCTWAQTIEELTEEVNFMYFSDPEYPEDNFSVEDMQNYDFLNKVGTTYFVIDFE